MFDEIEGIFRAIFLVKIVLTSNFQRLLLLHFCVS